LHLLVDLYLHPLDKEPEIDELIEEGFEGEWNDPDVWGDEESWEDWADDFAKFNPRLGKHSKRT
jgi:hypothetical protein